jgi:hypothetical protein
MPKITVFLERQIMGCISGNGALWGAQALAHLHSQRGKYVAKWQSTLMSTVAEKSFVNLSLCQHLF